MQNTTEQMTLERALYVAANMGEHSTNDLRRAMARLSLAEGGAAYRDYLELRAEVHQRTNWAAILAGGGDFDAAIARAPERKAESLPWGRFIIGFVVAALVMTWAQVALSKVRADLAVYQEMKQ